MEENACSSFYFIFSSSERFRPGASEGMGECLLPAVRFGCKRGQSPPIAALACEKMLFFLGCAKNEAHPR